MSALRPDVTVDAWTLRCYFNRSGLRERAEAGLIRLEQKKRPRQPAPGMPFFASVRTSFLDPATAEELARTHHYEDAFGRIVGNYDPKALMRDGVIYHLYGGNTAAAALLREPERRFRHLWQKKLYGSWRKIKCHLLGR